MGVSGHGGAGGDGGEMRRDRRSASCDSALPAVGTGVARLLMRPRCMVCLEDAASGSQVGCGLSRARTIDRGREVGCADGMLCT